MSTDSLGFMLVDSSRLLRRTFQQRMEGSALNFMQARVLINISRKEGIRQVDLADLLEIQPIALVHLLDQLAESKLVERRADPSDRRAYQLYVTLAAAPHLAEFKKIAAAVQSDMLRGLSQDQSDLLLSSLRVMRDNLSSQ